MEFRDLKKQYQVLKPQMDAAIAQVLQDCNFISGKQVAELEEKLAQYVGVKHCVTCGNGTDALSLVMMAWEIKEGDAVFVPDFTFFASAEVVAFEGATPIFVDVDERSFNIDPDKLEQAICAVEQEGKLRPRAVVAVDLFGQPADYRRIEEICRRHNLLLLEDGAQGFGGMLDGRRACSFGDAAATSFFPAKPLGCYGDGGAVFTNDDNLAELLRSLRIHGKSPVSKYDNIRIGINSRLDTFCILSGNACLPSALRTHSHIERLVSFFPEFRDRNIFPDFHTTPELHIHLPQHVDLRLNDWFFQPERRDSVKQHSARPFFFFKHCHRISFCPEIIRSRHTCRTGADDCDFLFKLFSFMVLAERNIPVLFVQLFLCNKLLDLIDCYSFIAPHTAGNGLSCLISFRASIYLPSAAILTYPCTARCAGQAVLHGDVPVS